MIWRNEPKFPHVGGPDTPTVLAARKYIAFASYVFVWTAGTAAAWRLLPAIAADPRALGPHAAGLLVPFLGALAFMAVAVATGRVNRRWTVAAFSLFVLVALPLARVWRSPIVNLPGDDSFRYSLYAHHMIEARTLWGSDGLVYGVNYFVDQPGYRYYVAGGIALLGAEDRGLQIVNLGLLLIATLVLLERLQPRLARRQFLLLTAFILASAPYAAKNVLYGYAEWLTIALAFLTAGEYAAGRLLTTVLLLALVPFVRQNLLVASLLVTAAIVAKTKRWRLLVPYVLVLGLPVYHNVYYAGTWRLLASNIGRGNLPELGGGAGRAALNVLYTVLSRIPHYAGYDVHQKWTTIAVAVLFAPYGTALVGTWLARAAGPTRWFLAAVAAATIAPTLIMGSGSFPRFEYVNLTVILLAIASTQADVSEAARRESTAQARNDASRGVEPVG